MATHNFPYYYPKLGPKISDLVREIFKINSQNDETKDISQQVASALENEVNIIYQRALEISKKYQDNIRLVEEIEQEFQVFRNKIKEEAENASLQFKRLSEQDNKDLWNSDIESLNKEALDMKSKLENLQEELEKAINKRIDLKKQVQSIEEEALQREQNEKEYEEVKNLHEELEEECRKVPEEMRERQTKDINEIHQEWNQSIQNVEINLNNARDRRKMLEEENKLLKQKLAELNKSTNVFIVSKSSEVIIQEN